MTDRTSTLLDPVIISEDIDIIDSGVIPFDRSISDHKGTYIDINMQIRTNMAYKRDIWCYNLGDYEKLNALIANTEWHTLFTGCSDVNEACTLFYEYLNSYVLKINHGTIQI